MCILPSTPTSAQPHAAPTPARALGPQQRQQLAVAALAGQTISVVADEYDVSRKFVYQQRHQAQQALDQAFQPPAAAPEQLLFWLPVTKLWLEQLVLGLVLICHSPVRGVTQLLDDVFDHYLSVGKVHEVLQQAVPTARAVTAQQDLSRIRIGAHDELYQADLPVLVGVDVASTYCYLLSLEDHADADTWAIRLWEAQAQGFAPDATIADFGSGLRAGQELALPTIPCRGDLFHALQGLIAARTTLEQRAYNAINARTTLERKSADYQRRHGHADRKRACQLPYARKAEAHAVALADDVALLVRWLREDVLAVAGPAAAERRLLYDFVVAELRARTASAPPCLATACRLLENQPEALLAFAAELDEALAGLAQTFQVPVDQVRELLHVQAMNARDPQRWRREATLRQHLRGRFEALRAAVVDVADHTVRASSVIENFNSRLRNYIFLRRHLGPDALALLQFFLNHRRFPRSAHAERVGKSPAELLTGQAQPHWLELLGYTRFSRT